SYTSTLLSSSSFFFFTHTSTPHIYTLSLHDALPIFHCRIGLRTTGKPPTSLFPSITSSFAKTVPNSGHQFTGTSATYASRTSSGFLPRYVEICSALFAFGLNQEL